MSDDCTKNESTVVQEPVVPTKKELIHSDPDFIDSPKYGNSLTFLVKKRALDERPLSNAVIAKMLNMSVVELESIYMHSLAQVKASFK